MYRRRNHQTASPNRYGPHAADSTGWPVVLQSVDFSELSRLPDESATVLEFAAILGEAIARAHLSGKQIETTSANAPVDVGRGVRDFVGSTKETSIDDKFTTKPQSSRNR